jgi:ribosomal-protein-alanine N-acetyltransferase
VIAAVESIAAHAPWTEEQVRQTLCRTTTIAFVAGTPGIGHLLASAVADEGEILTLAVHPAVRRQGVARRLLDACMRTWEDLGVSRGWLEVRTDNEGARALYVGAGWTEVGRRPRYYGDGSDALVLGWEASCSR